MIPVAQPTLHRGLRVLDIAAGTGRCEAQRPCRRRLSWLRQGAWFLPPRSAALHRPISRQEDLIYSPFSDCSSARRRPIFGLWLTWHHPAVRAMPCRAFRRLPHSAETQAAEMWPLFSPISVVSVFWLLDLTVVDLLPSSDPFTRYRTPAACRAAHSSLVPLPPPSRSVTRCSLLAPLRGFCREDSFCAF